MLEALRAEGLRPVVTLHHFTNPTWIATAGGWDAPDTASYFARFVARVIDELGHLADDWVTINEPTVVAYQGYVSGEWPPGKRNLGSAARVLVTLAARPLAGLRRDQVAPTRGPRSASPIILRVFDPARGWAPQDRLVAAAFQRDLQRDDASLSAQWPAGVSPDPRRQGFWIHGRARISSG